MKHYSIRHDNIATAQENGPIKYYMASLVKWAKTTRISWYRGLHMGIASTIYYGWLFIVERFLYFGQAYITASPSLILYAHIAEKKMQLACLC